MRYILSTLLITTAIPTFAEQSFSLYGGIQSTSDSSADVIDIDGSSYSIDIDWEGRSFSNPPYWGMRYTNWLRNDLGYAIEYTHIKAYSTQATQGRVGIEPLEFTDGINLFTASMVKRFAPIGQLRPYAGTGLGITIPHVELKTPLMSEETYEYQFGGYAATTFAGASYALNEQFSLFSEVKLDYSMLDVDMGETGSFKTNLFTQALNFGVSYNF